MLMKEKDTSSKQVPVGTVCNSRFSYMKPVNTRKQQESGREREEGTKDDIYIGSDITFNPPTFFLKSFPTFVCMCVRERERV